MRDDFPQIVVLKDRTFAVDRGSLCAAIPDPHWHQKYNPTGDPRLFWMLDIHAKASESEDAMSPPFIYHQNLHFPIRRWTEIAGREVRWNSPFDEQSGEPHGGFYVWEHGNIDRARLRLLGRNGPTFRIEWDGVCDVFWDEEYGKDVPFSIKALALFTEIIVRGSERDTDASLRARLAEYLDVTDFIQEPMQIAGHSYEDGVKIARSVFKPVAT